MSSIFFLAFKHELTFGNNEERDINTFIVSKQNKLSFFFLLILLLIYCTDDYPAILVVIIFQSLTRDYIAILVVTGDNISIEIFIALLFYRNLINLGHQRNLIRPKYYIIVIVIQLNHATKMDLFVNIGDSFMMWQLTIAFICMMKLKKISEVVEESFDLDDINEEINSQYDHNDYGSEYEIDRSKMIKCKYTSVSILLVMLIYCDYL